MELSNIHPTAILDAEGMSHKLKNGKITENVIHSGGTVICLGVEIGPYSVIHRGSWRSTLICHNTKIGSFVNVGHNCVIGENCLIAPKVSIGGSTEIGENCWIGMGALIGSHLKISPNVVIGMGSVVLENIEIPGVYAGNPCRFIKTWDGKTQPF